MGVFVDIKGERYGKLKVIKRNGNHIRKCGKKGTVLWLCKCDCGNTTNQRGFDLRNNLVVSCGCHGKNVRATHGMSKTRTYRIWHGIIERCRNKNDTNYHYYGGRGIKYAKKWSKFEAFYDDMGDCPSDKHTIDRINVNGDYKKSNCRWATRSEQMKNRRRYVNWNQKISDSDIPKIVKSKKTSKELAELYGVSYKHICAIRSKTARAN